MGLATLFLVTSFVVGSIAGPLSQFPENQCATTCVETKKFEYEVGKSYIYQYEATTSTELNSNSNEVSRSKIRALVDIQSISKCNFVLKLSDVDISNPEKTREFKSALEANPLDFSFQDGVVDALCPRSTNEPVWVLNIKRGILSTFQNSMKSLSTNHNTEETDITGKCPTTYQVGNGGWLSNSIITKSKDMLKCTDRSDHYTWIRSTPQQPSLVPQSSPIVKSSHECQLTIRQNILQKSVCKEFHRFQPLAHENSGATTEVQQTLIYQKTIDGQVPQESEISARTSLLFDHDYEDEEKKSENDAREALVHMCASSKDDITPQIPRLFSRLVNSLKKCDFQTLQNLFSNIESICGNNNRAKKLYMDAVAMTANAASVQFMTMQCVYSKISSDEVNRWLTTLSLLPNPTHEMIAAAMPLLNLEGHRSKALLGLSALTHAYCQHHNACGGVTEVVNAVKSIVEQIPTDCQTKDQESIERVVSLLKALGNIGHINRAQPTLKKCYENVNNPIEVRLAAIDAHRRIPCSNQKSDILQVYLNREEDSEVRIGAYLILMKCPTSSVLDQIESSLITEDVNQVGSFVWTHLTSLKKSENPNKMMVKEILSSKKLQKKFSTDVRKFSRYYEGSIFFESIEAGAHVEGSLIFSPKSYLPRSAHLGLNLDIFGESIDLFEIGARVEGCEQLVESFFGPQGHFPDETIHQMLESYRDKNTEDKSKLNQIANIFNIKNAKVTEPQGSFHTRIFGNDNQYVTFKGLDELVQRALNALIPLHKLTKLLNGEDLEFVENVMLVDSSLTIPTSIGFPLKLKVNGTAAISLQLGGKFDASQISSKSLTANGHIRPSAAVEIDGEMIVDHYLSSSGFKLTSLVHTSTEARGEFIVKDGQMIKSQFMLPKDKMEIFDFRSSLIVVDNDRERDINLKNVQQYRKCTGDFASKYFGLELCGELSYPSTAESTPLFLSGPVSTSLYVQKTDKQLTSFDFEYRWSKEQVTTKSGQPKFMRVGKLSLDTHKSAVNRELTAEFVHNEADETVSIRLVSPIKKATFNGKLINEPEHKKLDAFVLIDDNECLAFQYELRIENNGNNYRLTPSMAIRLNGLPVVSFKGLALTQDRKKYSVDLTLEHLTSQPITIYGLASKTDRNDQPRYDLDFNVKSTILETFGKWFYQSGSTNVATKGTIDYKWANEQKQSITFSAKHMISQQNPSSSKLSVEAEFQWTLYPAANWVMALDLQKNEDQMDNLFTLYYGSEQQRSHNMLSLQHSYRGHGSWPKHHLATNIRLRFPPANVDTTLEIKSDLTPKNLDTSFALVVTPELKLTLVAFLKRGDENTKELISGFTRLTYPNNELEISANVKQPELDTLVLTTTGKWAKSTEASLIVTVKNHGPSHLKSWGKEVRLELQLPNQKPLILAADAVINDEEHSAHGEAQINDQTYKTFAEYHRPSLENLRVVAGAKSPSTTYSATAEIQNKPKEKRVLSEVVLGNSRRLKSDVQFRKEGGKNSAYATFMSDAEHYPNDVYSIQMTFEKILLGSEGLITIKRPSGTEMGLEWKSKKDGNFGSGPASLNGQYQVWWAPGKKILTDINLSTSFLSTSRDLTVTIDIDTPWSKEVSIYAQHKDGNQQWNNNLDIQYEKQPILSVITDGTYTLNEELQAVRSNVKINFQQRLFTFKIDHQWNEQQLRTNAIINSGQVNEYRFMVLLNDKRTMEKFGFSSEINVVTPFQQARKVVWTADLSLVPKNLMFESQINWNGKILSAESKTNYVIDNDVNLQTNWKIKLPFENLYSIDADFQINNLQKTGFNSVFNVIYNGDKKILIDLVRVVKNNSVSLRIRSPCPYFEDVQLIAAGTELRDSSKIDLKVQWTPSKYAEAEIEWSPFTSKHFFYNVSVVNKAEFLPFEFRNDFEFTKNEEQFNVLFSAFLNEKIGRINIDLQRPESSDRIHSFTGMKWLGLFQLNTPFPKIQNLNLTAVAIQESRTLEGKIETAYNEHVASIFYFHSIDPHNLQQNVTITLPYEKLSSIKWISTSKSVHHKMFGERELSWTPGPVIKAYFDMDSPVNSNLSIQQMNYHLFVTPLAENKPIDIIKIRLDYGRSPHHNIYLGLPTFIDYGLNVVYFEEEIFDFDIKYRRNDLIGEGELSLRLPENGVKKFVATAQYDLSTTVRSSSLVINVNELEPIAVRVRAQTNYPKTIINVELDTPFIDYKTNSLNLDFDYNALVGQLQVNVNNQIVQVSIEFQNDNVNGRWIVNLKTPIQGFETTSLITDVNLSNPRDMNLRVSADGSVGQFSLQTSYKKNNQDSLQVGAVLTTSVPSFENLALEYVVEDKLHVLKIHKQSNLWISNQLSYDLQPGQGKLRVSVLTPWVEGSLNSDYALSERSKYLTLNYQADDFKGDFEVMLKRETNQIGFLKTHFKVNTFPDILVEGEYRLVNPENRVLLKIELGEYFKSNLEASSKATDRNEHQHRISLITSVENEKDVSVLGSLVTSSSKIVTKFEVKKDQPIISMESTISFPASSSLVANFQMTLPNTDDIQFNMNYGKDSSRNAIDFRSSIILGQVVTSIDFNYQNPVTDLYKLNLKMQIPQQKFSPVTSSVSLDLRQGQKKVLDFQVAFENARVEQIYRMISEFEAKTSGYLEYNLKLSTPEEDCRFYANYNVQGVHNVTYDAKLIKGKTMIESRGRFYVHPQWNRAQGSLSFNTNYQSMISANFNGMYEARPNEVEILLQSSINGADNELKIISSKVSTGRELVLQGMSSYPEWQKFSAKGTIKNENSKHSVQLTFKRNDDTFNVKGEFRKQSELTSGQFTLTTPYLEHQSLRINFNSQLGRWTFKITNNNEELINTDVTKSVSGTKTDLNVDLQSSIPWVEPIKGKLSFDVGAPSKIVQLNFNYGSVRFEAAFSGSNRRAEVNSLFTLKCSDILPYLNDDNLQIRFRYNMLTLNTEFIVATRSYSIVEVKGRRENGHIAAEFAAAALGSVNVKIVRPSPAQTNSTWTKAEFNVEVRDIFYDNILFQAGYDMSHPQTRVPNTYFTIQKGSKIVNFSSAVTISDAFSSVKIIFKSPLENYEDVELLVHNQKSPTPAFELSARLSPDRHYIFNGIFNPNNRDLNAEYVVLTFKSPLHDYKNLNLVVKPRGFSFNSGSKQLSVSYEYTDSLLVTLINSFSKISAKAQLVASWSATSASARLDFNDRFMDVKGSLNLQTLKSSWSLLIDNNVISYVAPFVLKGNYNLETFNKFAIAQKLDVNDMKVFDMNLVATSGKFDWSITSLLDNIKLFKVQSTFNSGGKISQANIQVQFNDKKWSAAGKYNKNDKDDGFSVQIENNFPVTGIKDLRILTKRNLEGKQKLLGGELYVNNKQIGTIQGTIESYRDSLRATLDINTPWIKTDKFEFLVKYDRETGDFVSSLQIDPTWIIKIEGKAGLKYVDLTLTTPFKDFDLVNVKAQLEAVNPKNELLFSSSVTYKKHVVAGLNIEFQRSYFQKCILKIDTITPFGDFPTPALHIIYNFDATNELVKIETVIKGKTVDTFYGLAGKFNYQKNQMVYGEITLTTPFQNYETITVTLNGSKNNANEYRVSLKLKTPKEEHSTNLNLILIPNKYSGTFSLASTSIPDYPVNVKFNCQKYNYELELTVAEVKRYIKWSENKDEAFNGNVIVGMESSTLGRSGYNLIYFAKPSISNIKVEIKSLATNENIIALVYSMQNQFFKMDVGITYYSKPLITFNYDATEGIKSVLKMTKPLFANPVDVSLIVSRKGVDFLLTANRADNYVKINIIDVKKIQTSAKLPLLNIPFTSVDVVMDRQASAIDLTVSISVVGRNYKISSRIVPIERADFMLETPAHRYELKLGGTYRGYSNMLGSVQFIYDKQSHAVSAKIRSSDRDLDVEFRLDSGLLDRIKVDVDVKWAPSIEGKVELGIGQAVHRSQFKVITSKDGVNIELEVISSKTDLRSVSLKSSLDEHGRLSRSIMVNTASSAPHSLAYERTYNPKMKKMQLTADTPYLRGGRHTLTGQKTNNEMVLQASTPKSTHSIKINVSKAPNGGQTVKVIINCPLMAKEQLQLTGTLAKIDRKGINGAFEFLKGSEKHKLSVDMRIRDRSFDYDISIQTPLYDINTISSRGQLSIVDQDYIVDVVFKKSDATYMVKGSLRPTSDGISGQIKVDSPYMSPTDINVKVSWAKRGQLESSFGIQTPTGKHGCEANVMLDKGSCNGVVRMNSPLIPGQKLSLTGNVNVRSRRSVQSYFAVENPGNDFKVSSEFHSDPEKKRVLGNLVIVTPFQLVPYIKMSAQKSGDERVTEGEIEFYTVEKAEPDLRMYGKIELDNDKQLVGISLNVQTSLPQLNNAHLKYEAPLHGKTSLVFTHDHLSYGYKFEKARVPAGQRKLNAVLLWGHRRSTLATELIRNSQLFLLSGELDTQLEGLPKIQLVFTKSEDKNEKNVVSAKIVLENEDTYAVTFEKYHRDNSDVDARLTLITPFSDFQNSVIKLVKSSNDSVQNIVLQVESNGILKSYVEFVNKVEGSKGDMIIRIKTPHPYARSLTFKSNTDKGKTDISMYLYDHVQPITFSYNIETNVRSAGNYKVLVSIPHSKYPLTLSLIKQTSSQKVFSYIAQISASTEESKQLTLKTEIDLQGPNYKAQFGVIHPSRTIDLTSFCAVQNNGDVVSSLSLKWDAGRDNSKAVGFDFKRQNQNNEHTIEVDVKCPGINKMVWRVSSNLDVPLDHTVEYIYGTKSTEVVTFIAKKNNGVFETRITSPETKLDAQFIANCTCNSMVHQGRVGLTYTDRDGKRQNYEIGMMMPKDKTHIEIKTVWGLSKTLSIAKFISTKEGYNLVISKQLNDDEPNKMEMQFKRLEGLKGIEIIVLDNFETKGSLSAGMPNAKSIRALSNRFSKGQATTDFDFQMELHQAKELRTLFNWKPEAVQEIQSELTRHIRDASNSFKIFLRGSQEVGIDILGQFYTTFLVVNENLNLNFAGEWESLTNDLEPWRQTFNQMYDDNDFYVRSVLEHIGALNIHEKIINFMSISYEVVSRSISSVSFDSISASMDALLKHFDNTILNWINLAQKQVQKMPMALLNILDDAHQWGRKFINNVVIGGVKLARELVLNWIPPVGEWKEFIPLWTRRISSTVSDQIHKYVEQFTNSKYYQQLQQSLHQLNNIYNEIYSSKLWNQASSYYNLVSDRVEQQYESLKSNPWFQEVEIYAEKFYDFGKWAYKFFRVQDMANHLLDSLIARLEDIVIRVIEDTLLPQYQIPTLTSTVFYEPQKGRLEFNQTLPVPWTMFTQTPDIMGSPEYQRLTKFKDDILELPKTSLKKLYKVLKSELSWNNVSPAFRATAILAGNQHYVTFDGKAYEFAGACSYVLASDFIDKKFILSVNYHLEENSLNGESATIQSFNLTLGKDTTIVIKPDLSFEINDQKVETPTVIETVHITRSSDILYIADESRQIFLTYNRKFEVLKFEIGGFYHGKTGGLFGTYDHEPRDDLTDPSQQKIASLERFGYSWQIDTDCKNHKNRAYHSDVNSYAVQKTCKQLFDDHSLSPGAGKIQKEAYVNMCVNDVSLGKSPCDSVAAYILVCHSKGYDVEMPESCLECVLGGSTLRQNEQVKISGSSIPNSADVVIVLDNTWQCSTTFPNIRRTVLSVARSVEQSLTKNKIPLLDNRFAMVGLGDNSPQAISLNGQVFNSAQYIPNALNATTFTTGNHHHLSELIEYAYDLPFRPGVAKIFLVIPCSESVDNEGEFDALTSKLDENNIAVHVVSIHDATLNEPNKVIASEIIGFDDEFAYTLKSLQRGKLIGNKEIRNQLEIEKNPLTTMAMETKGSVFFASKLGSVQPMIGPISNEIFSRRVALTAIPAKSQNCLCTVDHNGLPKTQCSSIY